MMALSSERKGELFIFFEALIWSFFPILTILAYTSLSPMFTYSLITLFAALSFAVILTIRQKWHDLKDKTAFKYNLFSTIFIGILYYGLFFLGLKYTTAGNAAIVALMEIFFSYVIFSVWYDQKHKFLHIMGAVIMGFGVILILFPGKIVFMKGDILILIATAFAPIGNHFQQKARKLVSSETILFMRAIAAGIFFFIASLIFYKIPSFNDFTLALPWLLISGVFLFCISKMFWIEGIHRLSVTKAISLSIISSPFTLIFAYFILHEVPTIWQIMGFIPIIVGGFFILKN